MSGITLMVEKRSKKEGVSLTCESMKQLAEDFLRRTLAKSRAASRARVCLRSGTPKIQAAWLITHQLRPFRAQENWSIFVRRCRRYEFWRRSKALPEHHDGRCHHNFTGRTNLWGCASAIIAWFIRLMILLRWLTFHLRHRGMCISGLT